MAKAWPERSSSSPKAVDLPSPHMLYWNFYYRGVAPLAFINTDIDQHSAPACSLEGIPYAYKFDADVIANINSGDLVELRRSGDEVSLQRIDAFYVMVRNLHHLRWQD